MHSHSPSHTARRRFDIFPRGQEHPGALPADGVLLFGLRVNAQNPNGFVVVGDAPFAEPYAVTLRKDDAPFRSAKGRSAGCSIQDSRIPARMCEARAVA